MEQRLAEFRARKVKEKTDGESSREGGAVAEPPRRTFLQTTKEKIHNVLRRPAEPAETPMFHDTTEGAPLIPDDAEPCDAEPADSSSWKTVLLLKFLLWLVLLGLFVELEFGMVYFILSMFYWLYVGTRRPGLKKKGEKSAYSVFNPGCEAIEGTLTAEQLERELLFNPLMGR